MKMISILLAGIIISLTFQPCCASENKCFEETASCRDDINHSSENEVPELPCSPFYSCGACPGFNLVSVQFITTATALKETTKLNSFYSPSSSETYILLLLKPPKQIIDYSLALL